jgi:hypothetical protein
VPDTHAKPRDATPDVVRRRRIFLGLVLACFAIGIASVLWGVLREPGSGAGTGVAAPDDESVAADRVPAGGVVVFRTLDRDNPSEYGHLAWAPVDHPQRKRTVSGLGCERLHFAAGTGICLTRGGALGTSLTARFVGPDLRVRKEVELTGAASRARMSPDGRYGAVTAFVSGHSYADPGQFSTRTTILDARRGKLVADLEDFTVIRDGQPFKAVDFNFWGVTFTDDSNRFYATLGTGGKTYLLRGDVRERRATVIHENVECPSLSPDGTRVVYKRLMESPGIWRYHVLDLDSGRETPLAETRPIDDQAEWLDDDSVLYRVDEETWVVNADGTGRARRWMARADSPAVLR